MPQMILNLDSKENKRVEEYAKDWGLSKHETIKKMVRDFLCEP